MRERLLLERIEQLQAEHKRAEEANKAAKEQAFRYASAFCVSVDAARADACLLRSSVRVMLSGGGVQRTSSHGVKLAKQTMCITHTWQMCSPSG